MPFLTHRGPELTGELPLLHPAILKSFSMNHFPLNTDHFITQGKIVKPPTFAPTRFELVFPLTFDVAAFFHGGLLPPITTTEQIGGDWLDFSLALPSFFAGCSC